MDDHACALATGPFALPNASGAGAGQAQSPLRPVFQSSRFCQGSGCLNKKGNAPKRTTYGYERGVPVFCKDHALGDMFDVVNNLCAEHGKQTTFGLPGGRAVACKNCKKDGMVDLRHNLCVEHGKHMSFGFPGGPAVACMACKTEDMVDVANASKLCSKHNVRMIFGLYGGRAVACEKCKTAEMVDVVNNLCACGSQLSGDWGNLCSACYAEANPDDPLVLARYKTEAKLKLYLNELEAGITSTSTFNAANVRGRRAPIWLGAREMDFYLFGGSVNLECDGGQHKKDVKRFRKLASEQQALDCETSLLKLANSVSVLRVDQEDIWNDSYDWRSVLKVMLLFGLERALAGTPVLICARCKELDASYAPFVNLVLETERASSIYEAFLCEPGLVTLIHRATGERTHWKVPETLSLAALPEGVRLAAGAPRQLTMQQAFKRHKAS